MIRSSRLRNLALALGLTASSLAFAGSTDDAMARLNAIMADDDKRQASYEAGHGITFQISRHNILCISSTSLKSSGTAPAKTM